MVLINNNYNNKQNTKEQIEEMLSVAATQSIQDVAEGKISTELVEKRELSLNIVVCCDIYIKIMYVYKKEN